MQEEREAWHERVSRGDSTLVDFLMYKGTTIAYLQIGKLCFSTSYSIKMKLRHAPSADRLKEHTSL